MKSYNGFSPQQRYKALDYHKEQIRLGNKPERPEKCDSCGQTHGILVWHSEDYSEPFGPHIGQHGLCYVCHMWIHCRFRNRGGWELHKKRISEGLGPQAMFVSNWKIFVHNHLQRWQHAVYEPTLGEPTGFIFDLD